MRLAKGATVEVEFPDEAKVGYRDFEVPWARHGVIQEWVRAGVVVRYRYRGAPLVRRELVFRFTPDCIMMRCAEVSLDGIKIGSGDAAIRELCRKEWDAGIFVSVRFIYEYPRYPSLPDQGIPGELRDKLDQANIKIEGSEEFQNAPDPWSKSK